MNVSTEIRIGIITLLCVVAVAAGVTAGAGETTVQLTPDEQTVTVGNTTSFDVVVDPARGGVGSIDLTVTLENADLARIESAEIPGSPEYTRQSPVDNGLRIAATGMDTRQNGRVTVATVIVNGTDQGVTDLEVSVTSISDETGTTYSVTETDAATLVINQPTESASPTPPDTTTSSGGEETDEADAGELPSPTAEEETPVTATPTEMESSPTGTPTESTEADRPVTSTQPITQTDTEGSGVEFGFNQFGILLVLVGVIATATVVILLRRRDE
jgi:hypothetical protein